MSPAIRLAGNECFCRLSKIPSIGLRVVSETQWPKWPWKCSLYTEFKKFYRNTHCQVPRNVKGNVKYCSTFPLTRFGTWLNISKEVIKGVQFVVTSTQMLSICMLHYQKTCDFLTSVLRVVLVAVIWSGLWEDRFYKQDHLTATTAADPHYLDLEVAPNVVVCTCTRITRIGITSSTHSFVLRQWFCHLSKGTILWFSIILNCWKCIWQCSSCTVIQIACFNI